jgi:uncharacterized membrane protein HdeD (DUF308 family)
MERRAAVYQRLLVLPTVVFFCLSLYLGMTKSENESLIVLMAVLFLLSIPACIASLIVSVTKRPTAGWLLAALLNAMPLIGTYLPVLTRSLKSLLFE